MKVTLELDRKTSVRWVLAGLLILAALSKIANPTEFQGSLAAYKLPLPDALLRFTAVVLPWLELLTGFLLVAGNARRAALVWAAALFAVFVLATGQAWARGLDIGCGCFNMDLKDLDPTGALMKAFDSVQFAFVRALLLLVGAVYLLRSTGETSRRHLREDSVGGGLGPVQARGTND
jgi:uncharacterized membrane protein YphA (DoxX/SURF4 family)